MYKTEEKILFAFLFEGAMDQKNKTQLTERYGKNAFKSVISQYIPHYVFFGERKNQLC